MRRFSSLARFPIWGLIGCLALPVTAFAEAETANRFEVETDSVRLSFRSGPSNLRSMAFDRAKPVPLAGVTADTSPADSALAAVGRYGALFGLADPVADVRLSRMLMKPDGTSAVRVNQLVDGIPVLAGELVVNLSADRRVQSMNGEVATGIRVKPRPTVTLVQARETAINAVAKWYRIHPADLLAIDPELMIYEPSLLHYSSAPARLVWRVDVTASVSQGIRELILVDAEANTVALHFNQVDTALNRETYTLSGTSGPLPGSLVCDESAPNCTEGGDADADAAHRFAKDTYDFYFDVHGRDGLDDAGMTLVSVVDWNDGLSCPNAFWNGSEMIYCDGLSLADDVVAHELTHGVTDYTSGLFYYYQSGAINESFSDLWGEFIDLTNGAGSDNLEDRWRLGEDIPSLGAIRDLADPTVFGDPDRITSPNYFTGAGDQGGVHSNSGVNNKAVVLLVDGGDFNGQTVMPLDADPTVAIEKVARIYYDAQVNRLTSGADYADLYGALLDACDSLVGAHGITVADCTELNKALDAVEMDQQPVAGFNPDAEFCPAGHVPNEFFLDDFEAGLSNFQVAQIDDGLTSNPWQLAIGYAASGDYSAWVRDIDSTSDDVLRLSSPLVLPANAYLHFRHAFDFEYFDAERYDGAVLEYSLDGGVSWADMSPWFDGGQDYNGSIFSGDTNPLAGREAFTATSHGYVSSRYDLRGLEAESFLLRFREANDSQVNGPLGWFVDDVRISVCTLDGSPPQADAGPDQSVAPLAYVLLDGAGSDDPDGTIVGYAWTQTAGPAVVLNGADTATPSFDAPDSSAELIFQLKVTDDKGLEDTDSVTIDVVGKRQPGGILGLLLAILRLPLTLIQAIVGLFGR